MENKHTAGQWKPEYNRVISSFNILKDGYIIATINDDSTKEFEEVEANAKLIAAAPELLEALKDCLFGLNIANKENPNKGFKKSIVAAEAAIKAATL